MSAHNTGMFANDSLPSHDTIVAMCQEAGYERRGIPLRNPEPSGPIIAWVKYGPNVAMAEARTQDWAARALSANPGVGVRVPHVYDAFSSANPDYPIGHIVMEYIDAPDCDEGDDQLVARAVQALFSIPSPSITPGPVGGGHIIHTFFDDWTSAITYDTAEELQLHMNGILRYMGDKRQVNLVADAHAGLRLCPCNVTPGNFKRCQDGTVVALDFHATCFLPPSFFAVAMAKAAHIFTRKVANHVDYPKSDDVAPMVSASYFLVPHGRNDIGMPKDLRRRKGLP